MQSIYNIKALCSIENLFRSKHQVYLDQGRLVLKLGKNRRMYEYACVMISNDARKIYCLSVRRRIIDEALEVRIFCFALEFNVSILTEIK